jgi:hypothetical protein
MLGVLKQALPCQSEQTAPRPSAIRHLQCSAIALPAKINIRRSRSSANSILRRTPEVKKRKKTHMPENIFRISPQYKRQFRHLTSRARLCSAKNIAGKNTRKRTKEKNMSLQKRHKMG